ncbi:MAG: OmpA family protein [Bacteroidia bacterium]
MQPIFTSLRSLSLLFVFFLASSAYAQTGTELKADKLFMSKAYAEAIPKYESVLKTDSSRHKAAIKLADCYRLTNNTTQCLKWYGKVVNYSESEPIHKYYYAQALMEAGNYSEARKWMSQYDADVRGKNRTAGIDKRNTFYKDSSCYAIKKLPTSVNSDKNDFSPAIYKDGLVFTSARDRASLIARRHAWTDRNFYYMYQTTAKQDGSYTNPSLFSKSVKTKYNDGPVSFTPDGKTMYFTRNNINGRKAEKSSDGIIKLKIFVATQTGDGKFDNEKELAFNNKEYNCAHPAISADGNTLYFASDMSGGQGGMDIWKTTKIGDGAWSTPENLGSTINTPGNEVFPFVSTSGMLYYSSDGMSGLGGLDVYEARNKNGNWKVDNYGAPINSSGDDFGLVMSADEKMGYFSSNRGSLDMDDDIYSFNIVKAKKMPFTITLADNKTGEKLNGTLTLKDKLTGETFNLTASNGEAETDLIPGHDYTIEGIANKYKNNTITAKADPENPKAEVRLDRAMTLLLDVLVLNNPKDRQPVANAEVSMLNALGQTIKATTDANGKIKTTELQGDNTYALTANANNKISDKNIVSTQGQTESKTYDQVLFMDNNGAICLQGTILDKSANNGPTEGATVEIQDVATGAKIYETVTAANGQYKTCNVEAGKTYRVLVKKPGYFVKSEDVAIPAGTKKDVTKDVIIDKIIVGKAIKIDNIYFDLGKWAIRPDAAKELDKIVKLMQENPDLVIELSSHTDCRSSYESNMTLSDKRAKSSAEYIISKGIDAKRITGKGYGETILVNKCECEGAVKVPCTEKEHQANRRTEFKVIGFIKDGVIYNPDGSTSHPK